MTGTQVPVTVVDVQQPRDPGETQENDGYVACRSRSVHAKLRV